jgi:hypothetical protein
MPTVNETVQAEAVLGVAKANARRRIEAGYLSATSGVFTFTSGGTSYAIPLSEEFQQLALLAFNLAKATSGDVPIPTTSGTVTVSNASALTVLASYATTVEPSTTNRLNKRVAIAATSTVEAADAINW